MASERNVKPSESVGEREWLIAEIDGWLKAWGIAGADSVASDLLRRCRAALEASHAPVPRVVAEIAAERARQIEVEGWSPNYDDKHHNDGQLAEAAACYTLPFLHHHWPWDAGWWKPTTTRRNLVKAAALIVAEIERLDRAAGTTPGQ